MIICGVVAMILVNIVSLSFSHVSLSRFSFKKSLVKGSLTNTFINYMSNKISFQESSHKTWTTNDVTKLSMNSNDNNIGFIDNNVSGADNGENDTKKFKKRRVALVCGFIGSNYSGLQYMHQQNVKTIEFEIESALYKIGCILESNHLDIKKIGWNRSSRTDKGVHAARLVISAKLEIYSEWIKDNDNRIIIIPEKLNKILPKDIKVYSCVIVSNSFNARNSGSWREYEYILPIDLFNNNKSEEENKIILNKLFHKYIGSHSFHNFHKVQRKDLLSIDLEDEYNDNETNDKSNRKDDLEINNMSKNKFDEKKQLFNDMEMIYNNEIKDILLDNNNNNFYSNNKIIFRERLILSKTYTSIYNCTIDNIITINNKRFYKIIIRGKSFLLNQIRLMIGAVITIALNKLPEYILNLSLIVPFHIIFPLAPAEGLLLVDTGLFSRYHFKSISHRRCLHRFILGYHESEYLLMNDNEYNISELFKNNEIYNEIYNKWYSISKDGDNNEILLRNFIDLLNTINPPKELLKAWSLVYPIALKSYEETMKRKLSFDKINIIKNTELYHDDILKNNKTNIMILHSDYLPEGITTYLSVYYKIVPSILLNDVLNSLATVQLTIGLPYVNYDNKEISDYIDSNGGLYTIASMYKLPALERKLQSK